jgi:4-hydroxy-3-methylbut-2-enyl diphosphate reductase
MELARLPEASDKECREQSPGPLRVWLLEPRGFCAGVRMAIEALEKALQRFGPPIYVYHEIVHNRWVVEGFRRRGVIFVEDLGEVPPGAVVLYSAHGVSPAIREEARQRGLRTIDATCPLVMKVHRQARRLAAEGYCIVLIGHAGHEEVVGTLGEAPEAIHLVGRPQDVDRLQLPQVEKVAYLTQTTLSLDDVQEIVARLRERFPSIIGPPEGDRCYATQNRQEAVRTVASQVDLVLVVGSPNSSNSRRLTEIARKRGTPAYLIDGPQEIRPEWLSGVRLLALTAGASAPEEVVSRCVERLCSEFSAVVEIRSFGKEEIRFQPPQELRNPRKRNG